MVRSEIGNTPAAVSLVCSFTLSSLLCSVECWRWYVTDYWVISNLIVINVNCSWKHFLLFCLLKQNNRPIIGRCRLSNGRYRSLANWPIIRRYRLSADNRCTSNDNDDVTRYFHKFHYSLQHEEKRNEKLEVCYTYVNEGLQTVYG